MTIYNRDLLALWYWNGVQKEKHQEALDVMNAMHVLSCAIKPNAENGKKRDRFMKDLKKLLLEYGICPQKSPFCPNYYSDNDCMLILSGKIKILEEIKRDCDIERDF